MSIKFKCSCGKELDVPDETAGREAFCPGCRKSVPVPDGSDPSDMADGALSAGADEREASEFKPGALASLLEAPSSDPSAPSDESDKSDKSDKSDRSSVEVLPGKIKFHCECGQKVAVPVPAPQSVGKCPRCKRTLTVPNVPGVTDRKPRAAGKKRVRTSSEYLGHCAKCGRRIEDSRAVFCPRCGSLLESKAPVPERKKTAGRSAQKRNVSPPPPPPPPPPSPPPSPPAPRAADTEVRQRSAREAAERAANLLRPSARVKGSGANRAPEMLVLGRPAGLGRRLAGFLLDVSAAGGVAAGAYVLAGRAELDAALVPSVLAAVAAFAVMNEVFFAALTGGRSLGLLVSGVGVCNYEGRPAGVLLLLVRLLAFALLFIGAPLALFDSQRRTLHDIVCGTTVRRLAGG